MDVKFIEVRAASGLYATGQKVAVSSAEKGKFELSWQDTNLRQRNRIKYGETTTEEDAALAAFG